MIQLVVDGIFLDLYENDPPKLTYSIEDITDTKITSVYSKTFRVPATKNNTEFFKTAFEINGYDFDVTAKVNAQILYDGSTLRRGYISLTKVYLTNYGDAADYEIVFLGETRDFVTELNKRSGSRTEYINSLDFSDLNFDLTWANISQSWQAYSDYNQGYEQLDPNGGLFSGSIIFPLVDFGNTYTGTTPNEAVIARNTARAFTQSAWPLELNRFRPMVRAKTVLDKIFESVGYTYESNFITASHPSPFHQVYLSAWGNEPYVTYSLDVDIDTFSAKGKINLSDPNYVTVYSSSGLVTTNFGFSGSTALKEISDANFRYNNLTGVFTARETGDHIFEYAVSHKVYYTSTSPVNQDHTLTFRLMKSGSATPLQSTIVSQSNNIYTYSGLGDFREGTFVLGPTTVSLTANLSTTDKVYVDVSYSIADVSDVKRIDLYMPDSYFKCILTPTNEISINSFLKADYKKVDFIRDILTKFRLTMAPDKNRDKHFIIEPWKVADSLPGVLASNLFPSYLASGDVLDWTDKLDLSKDTIVEPLFKEQKQRIVFKDKEDKDYWNQYNQDNQGEVFGTLNVDVNNDLLTGERQITTTLSPTIVLRLRGYEDQSNGFWFYLPHIYQINDGKYNPMSPNSRLLFWNGLVPFSFDVLGGPDTDQFYIKKEDTTVVSSSLAPMVTPYFGPIYSFVSNYCFYDLNWQREQSYYETIEPLGNSVYDVFWNDYITSIYDKWARRVSAYFVLDSNDLIDWDFNSVIFVKGTYYYVEKIFDVPIGKRESVKVNLIKLPYYTPTVDWTPPTPPTEFNVWGDWPVIWQTTTDIWDD